MITFEILLLMVAAVFSDKSGKVRGDCDGPGRLLRVPLGNAATVRANSASSATPDDSRVVRKPSTSVDNGSMVVVHGVVYGVRTEINTVQLIPSIGSALSKYFEAQRCKNVKFPDLLSQVYGFGTLEMASESFQIKIVSVLIVLNIQ